MTYVIIKENPINFYFRQLYKFREEEVMIQYLIRNFHFLFKSEKKEIDLLKFFYLQIYNLKVYLIVNFTT